MKRQAEKRTKVVGKRTMADYSQKYEDAGAPPQQAGGEMAGDNAGARTALL